MRLAALALIVRGVRAAVLPARRAAAAAARTARAKWSCCVDRSYSMAYGDRWSGRGRRARGDRRASAPADRASLVFFSSGAEVAVRSAPDRGRLEAAVGTAQAGSRRDALRPGAEAGRQHPRASRRCRGARSILISDFQRSGWQGAEGRAAAGRA